MGMEANVQWRYRNLDARQVFAFFPKHLVNTNKIVWLEWIWRRPIYSEYDGGFLCYYYGIKKEDVYP